MELYIIAVVIVLSAASPSKLYYDGDSIDILRQNIDHRDDGSYEQSFVSENGISVSESGHPEDDSYSVSGQFSYTAPDGVTYTVVYTAGEEGFQPRGDHLPTPVPTEYPTPEVPDDDKQAPVSYEPQYERAIVGYRARYI